MKTDPASQFSGLETSSISPMQSRYPGSSPFQDDDVSRVLFFGRATEAETLLHKILVEDLVVLYSRSGLGKTSLLNAGILKPLRERGFFPMICRVYVGDDFKHLGPLESMHVSIEQSIAQALENRLIGEFRKGEKTTLWEYFKTLEIWSPDDILLPPVLILDQFEELFTLYERDKRQAFIEQLGDLVRGSIPKSLRDQYFQPSKTKTVFPYTETPPKVKILISLREEYLGRLAELAQDLPSIRKSEFRLTPLQRENAERAIVKPALVDKSRIVEVAEKDNVDIKTTEPFSYDPGKLKEILDFLSNPEESSEGVEQNEVDPTQLQILCQYIEEKVRERLLREPGKEVVVDNELLPGQDEMRKAIQKFYDRAIEKIQSRSIRRNVLAMIENGLISREGRRLSLAQGDIQPRFHVSAETLQELAKVRLLRPEYRLGDTYYELSHDTLIKPIQQSRENRQGKKKKIIFSVVSILVAFGLGTFYLSTKQTMERVEVLQSKVDNLQQQNLDLEAKIKEIKDAEQALKDGKLSLDNGDLPISEQFYNQALFLKEKEYGPDSPMLLEALNGLALIHQRRQQYDEAVKFYDRALAINKKEDPNGKDTAASLSRLALLYQESGDYQKAVPLLEEALSIRELGPKSPDTDKSLNDLVGVYQKMGLNDQAQFRVQRYQIIQSFKNYLSLLSDKKVDQAIKYWTNGIQGTQERLQDMIEGTEYVKLSRIEMNPSDLRRNLAQARIDLVQKIYDKPPWGFSATVVFKKGDNDWKIAKLDYEPGGQWPWTSQRLIGAQDLQPFSSEELDLMRNEIYARHGWVFKRPDLQEHFQKQPWYYPRGDQSNREQVDRRVEAKLTRLEKQNIQAIISREKELKR